MEIAVDKQWNFKPRGNQNKILYASNDVIVFLTQEIFKNLFCDDISESDLDKYDTYLSVKDQIIKCHFDANHVDIW